MATILVERSFAEPVDLDALNTLEKQFGWCMETNGVRLLQRFVASDGRRMLCVFEAPDAEAVRRVNDRAGAPYERVWSATTHRSG